MNNYFTLKQVVPSSCADANQNLRFDHILTYMQDVSTFHSFHMNVDHDALLKSSNAFWVLTKIKFKIIKTPHCFESVNFNTWPTQVKGLRFFREYEFLGEDGANIQGRAEWCMLDATTGAIRKPSTVKYPSDMVHLDKQADVSPFIKFLTDDITFEFSHVHKVKNVDIDVNKHTNNVAYARMAINAFSVDEFLDYNFKNFEIHFIKQTYFDNEVEVYKAKTQNGVIVKGVKNNETIFCCLFS